MDYSLYRMYNPAWGRWLSADPVHGRLHDPQTQDLYAYVRNNPSNLTDPLGNVIAIHPCSSVTGTVFSFGTVLVGGFDFSSGSINLPEPRCPDGVWDGLLAVSLPDFFKNIPTRCYCTLLNGKASPTRGAGCDYGCHDCNPPNIVIFHIECDRGTKNFNLTCPPSVIAIVTDSGISIENDHFCE